MSLNFSFPEKIGMPVDLHQTAIPNQGQDTAILEKMALRPGRIRTIFTELGQFFRISFVFVTESLLERIMPPVENLTVHVHQKSPITEPFKPIKGIVLTSDFIDRFVLVAVGAEWTLERP
jgi:hypothetical protein